MTTSSAQSAKPIFNEIFSREADFVFRFTLSRVSNREQALDIVQETFMRLWQRLREGENIENVRAFLSTISHHLIIDWYRKKKAVPLGADQADSDDEPDLEDEATSKENLELGAESRYLIGSLGRLKPKHHKVLYLKYVKGLPPPMIGKALGISANSVSVTAHRGLCELRKLTGYMKRLASAI